MILYSTTTCNPCKNLKKTLEAEGLMDALVVVDDIEQFPSEVRGVPTLEVDGEFITGTPAILSYLRDNEGDV